MRHWLFRVEAIVDVVANDLTQAEDFAWRKAGFMGDIFNARIEHQPELEEALQNDEAFLVKRDIV